GVGELRVLRDPGRRAACPAARPVRRAGAGPHLMTPQQMKLARWLGLAGLFVLALLVPIIAPDPATTNIAVFTMMYVGLATAWNIMGGYTGYVSLGHAGFFGFGSYALGLMLAHL